MPYSGFSIAQFAARGADIRFVCSDCGASVVAPIAQVMGRFGGDHAIGSLQALAVCGQCDSIEVTLEPTGARGVGAGDQRRGSGERYTHPSPEPRQHALAGRGAF